MASNLRSATSAATTAQPNGTSGGPGSTMSLPASRSSAGPSTQAANDRGTNLDQLNDPAALAGVDLNAEEERMRSSQAAQARVFHLGRRAVLNDKALQAAVVKIAASYGLRFLEPDTLPMIAVAVQNRLATLIEGMVKARDHRASTSFLRPPPHYDGEFEQTGVWAPMWDEVMYDDVNKVFTAYEQFERAEERRERIARTQRDANERQEQAEREAAEAAAAIAGPDASATTRKGKKLNPAKLVTEQQSHELMQRTALAQLGGPKLPAWAMGGVASPALAKSLKAEAAAPIPPDPSSLIPLAASIERNRLPPDTLSSPIIWRDAVFALERERGGGSMAGGARALHTAQVRRGQKRAAPA